MRWILGCLLVTLAASTAQAQSAEVAGADAVLSATDQCTADAAFGRMFGTTGDGIRWKDYEDTSTAHRSGDPAIFRNSEWSEQMVLGERLIRMETDVVARAGDRWLTRASESGWQRVPVARQLLPFGAGAPLFRRSVTTREGASTTLYLQVEPQPSESSVMVRCSRGDMLEKAADEARGQVPPDAPRPAPPDDPISPSPPVDCTDRAVQAQAMQRYTLQAGGGGPALALMQQSRARQRLEHWLVARLQRAANIPHADMVPLIMRLMPRTVDDTANQLLAHIEGGLPLTHAADAAAARGDRAGVCRALAALDERLVELAVRAGHTSQQFEANLRAEATRRGVSLD